MSTKMIALLFACAALILVAFAGVTRAAPPDAAPAPAIDAGPDNGIGTSPSSPAVVVVLPDLDDPGAYVSEVAAAARAAKWLVVIALVVNALVWGLRRFGLRLFPWLGTDRGGTVLALTTGFLAILAVQLHSGHVDPWLLLDGLAAGALAIGQRSGTKKLATPTS